MNLSSQLWEIYFLYMNLSSQLWKIYYQDKPEKVAMKAQTQELDGLLPGEVVSPLLASTSEKVTPGKIDI